MEAQMNRVGSVSAAIFLLLFISSSHLFAEDEIRIERVQFAKGATSAVIKGRVKGYSGVDYLVRGSAGQTINVSLKRSKLSNYFNVLPPGSKDVAMYAGQTGEDFKGVLPTDGDYTIRVYLVRAAARRNESSDYTLTISVSGKALAPVPASKDAVIPGTPFHASAKIACVPYIEMFREKKPQECEAFVIRRGFDGTATVEIPQANSLTRRILFVKGKPVAADSPYPVIYSRKDDLTIVTFDTDERYEIPDALVFGG
jgi:hypothetical protein